MLWKLLRESPILTYDMKCKATYALAMAKEVQVVGGGNFEAVLFLDVLTAAFVRVQIGDNFEQTHS